MERHELIAHFAVFLALERLERSTWNGEAKTGLDRSRLWNAKTAMFSVVQVCCFWCGLRGQKACAARLQRQLGRELQGMSQG
jgi:hypothetical protein